MPVPIIKGAFAANGTFQYCDGCNLTSLVDLRTGGTQDPLVMASIVFKCLVTILFAGLWFFATYGVQAVYFSYTTKPRGSKVHLFGATGLATCASVMYVVSMTVPETSSTTKASFLLIYSFYVLFNLFAELWMALCMSYYVALRFHVLYGEDFIPHKLLRHLKKLFCVLLGLLSFARFFTDIDMATISLNGHYSTARHDLGAKVTTRLALGAKSIYLFLGVAFVFFSRKAYRRQRQSANKSSIPRYSLIASVCYFTWALCALIVHIISINARTLSQRGTHMVNVFVYDLPLLLTQLFLIVGAVQPDWVFDQRNCDPNEGEVKPVDFAFSLWYQTPAEYYAMVLHRAEQRRAMQLKMLEDNSFIH